MIPAAKSTQTGGGQLEELWKLVSVSLWVAVCTYTIFWNIHVTSRELLCLDKAYVLALKQMR